MTKPRPTSARSDRSRTHRSQSKPAKAQPILLDRLEAALSRQNVSLKRAALQSVAAAAFGFHNPNEFAAADLVPPRAAVLGRVSLPQGNLILVQDPAGETPYGLPEAIVGKARAQAYAISPYGGLVDLSGLTAEPDAIPGATASAATPTAGRRLHVALVFHGDGTHTYFGDTLLAVEDQVYAYCRANWSTGPSSRALTDIVDVPDLIQAYFSGHDTDDVRFGSAVIAPQIAPGADPAAVSPDGTLTIHVAVHDFDNGGTTYVDTTKAGLYGQVADAVRGVWNEVEDKAGPQENYPNDRRLVEAYFEHSDDDTLDVSEHTVGTVAPEPDPDAAWRAVVADVRRTVEACDPGEHWAQHTEHDTASWQEAVANGDTRSSYWEWLAEKLDEDASEREPDAGDADPLEDLASPVELVTRNGHASAAIGWSGAVAEDPVYRRADWSLARRAGLTLSYAQWLDECRSSRKVSNEDWLTDSVILNTAVRTRLAQPCDAILRVHLDLRHAEGGRYLAKPGEIVRTGTVLQTEKGVFIPITFDNGLVAHFESDARDGMIPLTLPTTGISPEDHHPVYIHADWLAERTRGARFIDYADWVRQRDALNVRRGQQWLKAPCVEEFRVTDQRCIIHVHGEIERPAVDGQVQPPVRYAPGDSVFVQEAEFRGAAGHVTLATSDGAVFQLHSDDRSGYLPITPVRGAGLPLAVSEAATRFYPQADWLAEAEATDTTQGYEAWVLMRHAKDAVQTERWLTLDEIRALPKSTRLQIHIHHRATIHDPDRRYRTDCQPGSWVHVTGIDDRTADVSVALLTQDGGHFALKVNDRGGYLPVSVHRHGAGDDFATWLDEIEAKVGEAFDPRPYKAYYLLGKTPAEAIAAVAADTINADDATDEAGTDPTAQDSDAFMWEVAEHLGRIDLTHDAAFQQFCANMADSVTTAQAAESWERR